MSLIKPFSEQELKLIDAMRATWQAIAPDAFECHDGDMDRDGVVELVCDANRIQMFGGPEGAELDKFQFNLHCNDHDRFLEIAVEAFPEDTYC